ncbi:Exostosin family protein [Hibiscus syriacus]|uniref:Exostosin family protein n=1 Tax=Hibiscus syriacus TaxID=106335 RepID=A0A6A2ZI84_HIBSY|nr:Exostosin family protein [Hibiscus syriacus]
MNNTQIYHDTETFLEDFREMNKSFKIFVYPHKPDDPFANVLFPVDFDPEGHYASELYFNKALFNSHFFTKDPNQADLFYMPFSIADMRHDPRIGPDGLQDFIKDYIFNISHRNQLAFFAGQVNSPTDDDNEQLRSKFCLHVKGFEVNTARVTDALHYGCVPVILANHYDLPFTDILYWKSFSVVVHYVDIPVLKKILQGISFEQLSWLQNNVMKVRKHFKWNAPAVDYDAFYMAIYEL